MAQGSHKLGKTKRSGGSQKRKAIKTVKKTKKGNNKVERNKAKVETTKAINRKNERIIASKALNAGTTFSLKDISEKGMMLRFPTCAPHFSSILDSHVISISSFLDLQARMSLNARLQIEIKSRINPQNLPSGYRFV